MFIYLKGNGSIFGTELSMKVKQNIEADAPLDKLPLFIKAGSIIPVGEKVQYAMQKVQKPIQLFVYPGADGVYQLYEDEGESYAYEHGEYSTILF